MTAHEMTSQQLVDLWSFCPGVTDRDHATGVPTGPGGKAERANLERAAFQRQPCLNGQRCSHSSAEYDVPEYDVP